MNDTIFAPQFNTTTLLRQCLEALDRNHWLVENMLLMPKHEAWLKRDVTVSRASGTTRIEGAGLDERAVGRLLRDGRRSRDQDEQDNINASRAYEFVDYLSDETDIPLDEFVIRQLNREFMYAAPETLTPGIYRKGQNTVGGYAPPNQGDVPGLMRAFGLWLRSEDGTDRVLKSGIAHIHLVAIHPFWDGNGRTARALSTLVLQRSPYHFRRLLSLEADLYHARDLYFSTLERTLGPAFSEPYDVTGWLEFYTGLMLESSQKLINRLTDWHRLTAPVLNTLERHGLKPRQADGLLYAVRAGSITRAEYMEVTGVLPITASRDLAQLTELGLLAAVGRGRARYYLPVKQQPGDPDPQQEPLPGLG